MKIEEAQRLWAAKPGWLNTASYGLPPRPAWDALQAALADWRGGAARRGGGAGGGPGRPGAALVPPVHHGGGRGPRAGGAVPRLTRPSVRGTVSQSSR